MLYEEKVAKRFAKIVPKDFDFWEELDSCLQSSVFFNDDGSPVTHVNKDEIKLAICYVLICYGMYELKSAICAMLVPQVLARLITPVSVELALLVLEEKKNGNQRSD